MIWRKKSKWILVYYGTGRVHGNAVLEVSNFSWTKKTIENIRAFISKENCDGDQVVIKNIILLSDERG